MQLGEFLRKIRKSYEYTLSEVKNKTGLSISLLSDVERGTTKPSLDTLEKLAGCYETTVNELLKFVDFGTEPTGNLYPPGFKDFEVFLEEQGIELDEDIRDLLLQVEYRATKSAKTKEDWMQRYYSLRTILGR